MTGCERSRAGQNSGGAEQSASLRINVCSGAECGAESRGVVSRGRNIRLNVEWQKLPLQSIHMLSFSYSINEFAVKMLQQRLTMVGN